MDDPRIADLKRAARTTWATGDHPGVAERDIREVAERTVERDEVAVRLPSPEQAVEYYATRFGPLMAARALAEEQGRWVALREDLLARFAGFAEAGGGPVAETREYVRILGTEE